MRARLLLGSTTPAHRDRGAVPLGVGVDVGRRGGGLGDARRDGVDADAVDGELQCHGARHRDDRSLRRPVGDVERRGVHAADRADRDDRPRLALRAKFTRDGLAGEERRLEVGGEQLAPVRPRHPRRWHPRRRGRAARDVDETPEVALGLPHLIHDGGNALVGGRVGGDRDDGETAPCQGDDVLVEVLLRPADGDDGGAGLGGHGGHRGADAAATRAGHHHDATVEAKEVHDSLSVAG